MSRSRPQVDSPDGGIHGFPPKEIPATAKAFCRSQDV